MVVCSQAKVEYVHIGFQVSSNLVPKLLEPATNWTSLHLICNVTEIGIKGHIDKK